MADSWVDWMVENLAGMSVARWERKKVGQKAAQMVDWMAAMLGQQLVDLMAE